MSVLRYAKTMEQVRQGQEENPEFADSSIQSVRVVYETDPAIYQALVPKPLQALDRPEVCVDITSITMHLPHGDMQFGSAIFGVRVGYEGREGIYLITMPMSLEQAVVAGRDTFGEPKKLADIVLSNTDGKVHGKISRAGFDYIEFNGDIGASRGPQKEEVAAYCFKIIPSCDQDKMLDFDPLLVRLDWKMDYSEVWDVENAQLTLRDSPLDPVADVPVRKLVSVEYDEGRTASSGTVLRSVPEDYVLPFMHQRYDDMSQVGIEI